MTLASEPSATRFLYTRRLVLRAPMPRDMPALCRMLNDPEIAEHLGPIRFPYAPRLARQWLSCAGRNKKERFSASFLLAFRSNPRLFAGMASISLYTEGMVEFGYWVAREHRRRGYASEAVRALASFIFDSSSITSVIACTGSENHGSWRVLRRIGMHRAGTGHSWSEQHHRYMRIIIFRIVREDWERSVVKREARNHCKAGGFPL